MTCMATWLAFMKDVQQMHKPIDASTDRQASIVGIDGMKAKVYLRLETGFNAHADFLLTASIFDIFAKNGIHLKVHKSIPSVTEKLLVGYSKELRWYWLRNFVVPAMK